MAESRHHGTGKATADGCRLPAGGNGITLLANTFMHYTLDLWVQKWRKQNARGDMMIVRYCDDFVLGFQHDFEAQKFLQDLRERLAQFKLELHPEKTRLISFGRFAYSRRKERKLPGAPQTFNFLGLTHCCSSALSGKFMLVRHTMRSRLVGKVHEVTQELCRRRTHSVALQGKWLAAVLRGYYAYYGVPTNIKALDVFRREVTRRWLKSLRRRSQRHRLDWARMARLVDRWLPTARIVHPWPEARFAVRTQDKSLVR
jgi:RNA-directed DNA polymerase